MKIILDDREDVEIFTYLLEKADKIKVEQKRLDVGDFVCGDCCIERKTIGDFIGSMIGEGKRLPEQLVNMTNNYKRCFLLISGRDTDEKLGRLTRNCFNGLVASVAARYGVTVLTCKDDEQLVDLAVRIMKKCNDGKGVEINPVKLKKSLGDRKLSSLTAIEGVSKERAKRLLKKFDNLTNVMLADEKALEEVEGIGAKLSKSIKEFWG